MKWWRLRLVIASVCMLGLPFGAGLADEVQQQTLPRADRRTAPQGDLATASIAGSGAAASRARTSPPSAMTAADIQATARTPRLTPAQAAALWAHLADLSNTDAITLPVLKALVAACDTPEARQALWGELASMARLPRGEKSDRTRTLIGVFERNRADLLPLLKEIAETPSARDDMIELMLKSRVFADDRDESVAWVSGRIPAAVAQHIERERGLGHPVPWEYVAFESMMRWKDERLVHGAPHAPMTLAGLDDAGASFITIFNCLHELDEGFREVILRGLGPVELFNAVVAGEKELYRLGTSGYRNFLHPIIMRGIASAGSFEEFLDRAAPASLGRGVVPATGHRGMVFLRVASSFGLIEPVLKSVRNREHFIREVVASLDDPASFEENSSVVLDVLTLRSNSAALPTFRQALLAELYRRYDAESSTLARNALGSVLSVYQTMTGDHRVSAIDRAYALDANLFQIPFDRLYEREENGGLVHRMFMRMDEGEGGAETYASFREAMKTIGAEVEAGGIFDVFKVKAKGRTIEIYANAPTSAGVREGIPGIARALHGKRVETIIGRGHTSIIAPLQQDAKRVLGRRIDEVAAVIVGACGGDASLRELISTFGYIPYFATKATGRTLINNAIIKTYVKRLLELAPDERLSVADVRDKAVARFLELGMEDDLRSDASQYQVNMTAVLSAKLFDAHVRPQPQRRAALD